MGKMAIFWLIWSGGMVALAIFVIRLRIKNDREKKAEEQADKTKESEKENG